MSQSPDIGCKTRKTHSDVGHNVMDFASGFRLNLRYSLSSHEHLKSDE